MASSPEKLLEVFEDFEQDLEVEDILKKVKEECVLDDEDIREFGEKLKERERQKQAAHTNVSPRESFVQLLNEDSRTLLDLDSGAMQVAEPPDLDDLSFLQNISPDEWAEVLKDVEDSSSFDLETLVPPEDLVHVEDMSPDEGSAHEKLLEAFEDFEQDLEVEDILKKVKEECVLDDEDIREFGEKLKERERQKQAAHTNVSPRESFVQLLNEDSRTLLDLDSGAMQVAEPPDLDDLSFLQNISPDEWAEVLKDVEDSSSLDLEPLLPPDGIVDLFEDMSPDEGVDFMYDLVT